MGIKSDKYHRDYLLWIYPLIILGVTIFVVKHDEPYKEFTSPVDTKIDTSMTKSTQPIMVYNLSDKEYSDSIPVFYPAKHIH